jgi:cytochrome c-type biogenesis protein CcmH/NrfG
VAESPRTASLHLKLGYAHEEAQQYDKAIAQWRMTLDLEPDHPNRMKLLNLIEKYRTSLALAVGPTEPAKPAEPSEKPAAEEPSPQKGNTKDQ